MKLLLTSGGVTNDSIRDALVGLLGKPISESRALYVPTAQWGHPMLGPASVRSSVVGEPPFHRLTGLGWASVGVLELTALPSIGEERWVPWVREADVLLVDGGDASYLCHWIRKSGLADVMPSLSETVWVGMSAGSMVLTPRIGDDFVEWQSAPDDRTLGVVDFSIFPHVDHEDMPENTMAEAESWAAGIAAPAYAIDDQTALKVTDGTVEVVSEGQWKHFPAANTAPPGDRRRDPGSHGPVLRAGHLDEITNDAFQELVETIKYSAVHLETRDAYGSKLELPQMASWAAGGPEDLEWLEEWCATVRGHVAAGRTVQRARIVSEPLSEYQRWSLTLAPPLVAAGEDIRWIPRRQVSELCIPGNDFYLLDDERVVFLHYAGSGMNNALTTTTNPATVARCRTAYDQVWALAIPHSEYRPA